jgi:hypothetical protein
MNFEVRNDSRSLWETEEIKTSSRRINNQVIIRSLLEDLGQEVEIAEDGLQALEALSQRDFDMVPMDGRMSQMDDEEATRPISMGGTEALKARSTSINIEPTPAARTARSVWRLAWMAS